VKVNKTSRFSVLDPTNGMHICMYAGIYVCIYVSK